MADHSIESWVLLATNVFALTLVEPEIRLHSSMIVRPQIYLSPHHMASQTNTSFSRENWENVELKKKKFCTNSKFSWRHINNSFVSEHVNSTLFRLHIRHPLTTITKDTRKKIRRIFISFRKVIHMRGTSSIHESKKQTRTLGTEGTKSLYVLEI